MVLEHRDCAAIDEMLPAYALNALDEGDRAQVEFHLLSCERHEDAAAWNDVALRMAGLVPATAPPEGLRDRILGIPSAPPQPVPAAAAVKTPPAAPVSVPPAPVEGTSEPPEFARPTPASVGASAEPGPGRAFPARFPWTLAAVFAALAVFFAAWTGVLVFGNDDEGPEPTLVATASAGGIEARASYIEAEQVALVRIEGLTGLPEGSDYQLWAISPEGDPQAAGILEIEGGTALASVSGEFQAGWAFAVTIEPGGGSAAPTSDPIVAVTFEG